MAATARCGDDVRLNAKRCGRCGSDEWTPLCSVGMADGRGAELRRFIRHFRLVGTVGKLCGSWTSKDALCRCEDDHFVI